MQLTASLGSEHNTWSTFEIQYRTSHPEIGDTGDRLSKFGSFTTTNTVDDIGYVADKKIQIVQTKFTVEEAS